jgi:hypothetical protein
MAARLDGVRRAASPYFRPRAFESGVAFHFPPQSIRRSVFEADLEKSCVLPTGKSAIGFSRARSLCSRNPFLHFPKQCAVPEAGAPGGWSGLRSVWRVGSVWGRFGAGLRNADFGRKMQKNPVWAGLGRFAVEDRANRTTNRPCLAKGFEKRRRFKDLQGYRSGLTRVCKALQGYTSVYKGILIIF